MMEGFRRVLCDDALATIDELVPRRQWRTAVPASFWRQSAVMGAMDQRARLRLHTELIETIGADAAHAAMEYLPPVPWRVLKARGMTGLLWPDRPADGDRPGSGEPRA